MSGVLTRRAVLALLPGGISAVSAFQKAASVGKGVPKRKGQPLPSVGEFFRFADPTTESIVVRLTNPKTRSLLPSPQNRFVSTRNYFLIFSSDRTGTLAPFQVNLRTGVLRQLGSPSQLQPHSLCLDAKERFLYFLDGTSLKEVTLSDLKTRTVASGVSSFSLGNVPTQFVVRREKRLEKLDGSVTSTIADDVSTDPVYSGSLIRPGNGGCTFWREGAAGRELWYFPFAGKAKSRLLAQGPISNPFWSPGGESLLFLRDIQKNVVLSELHEVPIETGIESRVAPTSQFAAFSPNGDGSVFVGASRSRAQPNVILLLRTPNREFTLCEHHATDPASVSPVFSPNSQRVYFQSDREGKPAIYSVNVEPLVEPVDN
jgi:oligogalacturonide lyase